MMMVMLMEMLGDRVRQMVRDLLGRASEGDDNGELRDDDYDTVI